MFNLTNFTDLDTRKKYLLIGVLVIVIILILIITLFLQRKQTPTTNPVGLTPTLISGNNNPSTTITGQPLSTPLPFTGAQDIVLTKEEIEIVDQERALRRRSPYNGVTFIIQYNYQTYGFDVQLTEPKEQARTDFQTWIQQNYPAIKQERFRLL